jgi:SH3-like domain-containing protein
MKRLIKKTWCLVLLLFAGSIMMAQSSEKTWGLATLSVSNIRSQPDHASELVTQVLMGTPVKILELKDKWYHVQTPENYTGWMDAPGLKSFTDQEFNQWKGSNRYLFDRMFGFAYDSPSKKGKVVTDLVLGDLLEIESVSKGFFKIRIPDGRTGYVQKDDFISYHDWTSPEPNVNSVLSVAGQMMGTPYLWGGTSDKGVDCSGFVKTAFYANGVILARDASQQAMHGQPVDFSNMNNLLPGDLLFFGISAQHITHVGIYLGNGEFIHSSGMVHISSIVPGNPAYDPNRKNVAVRRIMNSLNSDGITRVKDHPWYNIQP